MKKNDILCAVDFSESSMDALQWTFDEAVKTQSKVTIMFCYRLIAEFTDGATIDLKYKIEEAAKRKFREFELRNLNGLPVTYKFVMEVGFYHFRIEMFLQKNPVGLLVIGGSIVENFDEYKNLGFEKFIKQVQIPVVIVPHEKEAIQSQSVMQ